MRAIVQDKYGSAEVLELRDMDKPGIGDDEVLVRIRAAAVNPADWSIMTGLPYIARMLYGLRKPKNGVRGTDVAGEVEAIGTSVTRFRPGDEVFGWCNGSFAEYAATSEDALALKPANLTFEQAAAVPESGQVALQALRELGWTGDDLQGFIHKEMASVLLEEPRLAVDHLARLLAERGKAPPAVPGEEKDAS